MAACGRGWGQRCPGSAGKKCRCSCQGERHGVYRKREERDLRDSVEPLVPVPLGGFTVGADGHPQLVLSW
jgi:hypothetical protein